MNYTETIHYIESRGLFGMKLGLETVGTLLHYLGDPQKDLRCIHIAGTNGKGSTATMTSAILTRSGYRVGLYTSPALESFNERIRLDGRPISNAALIAVTEKVRLAAEAMGRDGHPEPTGFEIETAMAFLYFKEQATDFAVIEVGMGGRLDATNIIPAPVAAVITRIGLDHTAYLGTTLTAVAGEKAAIIKPGCTAVMAPQVPEARQAIAAAAARLSVPLIEAPRAALTAVARDPDGQTIACQSDAFPDLKTFRLALKGRHQIDNCATVLAIVQTLRDKGFAVPTDALTQALAQVVFPGRFETLCRHPLILIDGAHNVNGIESFVQNLDDYFPGKTVRLYLGMLADKDIGHSLELLIPKAHTIATLTPDSDRALDAQAMAQRIQRDFGREATACSSIGDALASIRDDDTLHVFVGSLYLIGRVRTAFFQMKKLPGADA